GSENRPPMLNKENYVPWSSSLLRYAKSRPNGKLIRKSIINGIYVRRMIPEPGDPNREVPMNETFHEIWLRVQQMIKGPDIGIQEKKDKLFNEWERFTSTDWESIESYYHRFLKLMNDLKRNKHFPEKIASNLKFLNNLKPKWSRHVTIVHQTKELHTTDYTKLYDFLKYNQKEVDDLKAKQLTKTQDPLALMIVVVSGNANQNLNGNENLSDLDEIEEGNANRILMANLQQASTSGTQTDKAHVYDSDGSAEVHNYENCYDNEIFNMFTQEEQYTELLEPIPEPHQVSQNDNNVISKVSDQKDTTRGKSTNTKFAKQSILGKPPFSISTVLPKVDETHALSKPVTSNSIPAPQESKVMKNVMVIALGMFRINPFKPFREEKHVPNKVRKRVRTNPITVSQPPVITKKFVNSDSNGLSSTGVDNTKTRRPQPRSNTKNDKVPSTDKSSQSKNKEVKVEKHHQKLLLSRNKKHMSSECNNVKLATQDVKSKVVYAMCKQCLNSVNHDVCLLNYVNGMTPRGKKQTENVSINEKQKKQQPKVKKTKKVGSIERIASPKPSKPRSFLRVYFVEGLGHNLFSVGQFCDSDLEVNFRRNASFVRNLEGVDLLSGNRTKNLYTINLHEMASASPICLMARASSTKSWLWHRRLPDLNFDTINDLAKNDFVNGLPKFKYYKEHICPSCEQGKSKRASHPPKPVPNSKPSSYGFVSKDETPEVIKTFLKRTVLLQSPIIIIRTDNGSEFKNQVLKEYFDSVGISHQVSSVRTPQQNGVVERRNRTLVEAARTMLIFSRAPLFLYAEAIATACFTQNRSIIHRRFNKTPYELINGRKSDISFFYVFGALCYPKNDRKDIGKLGAKGDISFFIGYSTDSCAYRVYNRRTKKIMETMNVSFSELSVMAFEQRSSKPGLQSMTSGQITMYDEYIGGQPSTAPQTVSAAQAPQDHHTSTTSTSIADTAPTPTNSSSQSTNFLISSQDVDGLNSQQQHAQHQGNQAPL
nr:retrovirus-related Pol polyprotein from transposon TNT 1-94 [Tanacetum cinerariifolium]